MKTFQQNLVKLLMIGIACSFAASATTQAGAYRSNSESANDALMGNSRLIVRRAADFGTINYLNLYIDGVRVTTLALNERFEAIVPPGPHILSVATGPGAFGRQRLSHRHITMNRGQTYAFTALWEEADRAVLETSSAYRVHLLW